jgi:hypothetical protein
MKHLKREITDYDIVIARKIVAALLNEELIHLVYEIQRVSRRTLNTCPTLQAISIELSEKFEQVSKKQLTPGANHATL